MPSDANTEMKSRIPDDWGQPDGQAPRSSCLAISARQSDRGAGTAPTRWYSMLLLSSYLCRIKRKENSSCSACGLTLQDLTSSLTVPHPSLSSVPSSSLLLPFLTSGPDLGAWPNCWVSVEFLHAPIPQKGSDCTTTKSWISCFSSLLNFNSNESTHIS